MFFASRTWFNFVPLVVHLLQGHLMESIPWWFNITSFLHGLQQDEWISK